MPVSEKLQQFRDQYRRENVADSYSGPGHLAFTCIFSLGVLVIAIWNLDSPSLLEWLTVPIAFLYSNLVEYWMHRTVMHRPIAPFREIYKRHSAQHHVFFTDKAMSLESSRDLHVVLFPPLLLVFFIGGFAVPAGMLLAWIATPNVAWLFVAVAAFYLLNYELFHTAYHLPQGHWVENIPLFKRFRSLHWKHHDTRLMAGHNFNVTYPIGDWIFRTRA